MPSRQLVVSEIKTLVERFNTLNDRVFQQNLAINDQLASYASQVTAISESIAKLNVQIEDQMGQGKTPNGLLDQRDEFLRQLSEIVSVKVVNTASGSVDVFIGNGQPLVSGSISNGLKVQTIQGSTDKEILFSSTGGDLVITNLLSGGALGGALDFRDNVMSETLNTLGRIALSVADTMNRQNREGLDFEGNFGGNIFGDINSLQQLQERVVDGVSNAGTGSALVRIDDTNKLTTHDYKVTFSGGQYSVIDTKLNQVIS